MSLETETTQCGGRGQCHGPLAWCATCGDVDDVCSSVDCDTHGRRAGRSTRLAEVLKKLNTPEVMDFTKGVRLEAAHQRLARSVRTPGRTSRGTRW